MGGFSSATPETKRLSVGCDVPSTTAAIGASFGAGLFLVGTFWIYHSVHTVAHAPVAIALLLLAGLVVIMIATGRFGGEARH